MSRRAPTLAAGPRMLAALAGVVAGLTGLAVASLLTSLLRLRLTPVYAVAESVIDLTPGRLAVSLVHLFGRWDKPLLVGGTVIGLVALSAVAGLVARTTPWLGHLLVAVLAVLAGAAALTRPQASALDVVPVVVGWGVWSLVLGWLLAVLPHHPQRRGEPETQPEVRAPEPEPAAPTPGSDRRTFLVRAGAVSLGALLVGIGGQALGRARRGVERARARLALPVSRGTVPSGADLDIADLSPWRTPNPDFYRIDTALVLPTIDVDTWQLRIHGMVSNPMTLSFQDLVDRQLTEAWVTLCCVSNEVGGGLIGNAWWSGVRIADLLAEASPSPEADAVLQTSQDGWNCGTPLRVLTDDRNALVAIAMNGEPLPLEHGFPVRMVVPGLYGYVSATKWLVDLEVTRFEDFEAFWTQRGWAPEGPVKTQSRIDVPRANHRVAAGAVRVAGVAWAQHTGIQAVELRVDEGAWQQMDLGRVPSVDTWVQWTGTVEVDPGVHSLAVRATDRSGYTQTDVRRGVVPDGATGRHTIELTAE